MKSVNGAEDTVLKPAEIKLVILNSTHVTANVMAPPGVSCVCGAVCEIGLEIKAIPAYNGVAREAERIAVATESCVS